MRAYLIFNPNAGGANGTTPEELCQLLLAAGYEPVYQATNSEEDLDNITCDPEGIYVVAGGDGSVRAVALRLLGKKTPISILPFGTANNIASSLGIGGLYQDIIARLRNPVPYPFDVGSVHFPGAQDYFLEAFGVGLFADALANYQPEKGRSAIRSFVTAIQTIAGYESKPYNLILDGQDLSGNYLMVEVLNTSSFGPWLKAAPRALPGDGLLDVICVHEENREGLFRYALAMVEERLEELPSVDVMRGRKLEIRWSGYSLHADAEVHPKEGTAIPGEPLNPNRESSIRVPSELTVTVEVIPAALEFWLPQPVIKTAQPG